MHTKTVKKQVISRKRVIDHGEVFTNEREVNAMLDLVKRETERIDSRFLEPACGDGNFLSEILKRKLQVVEKRYKRNQKEFELYSLLAIGSIYGVEILQDNVDACRERLYEIFNKKYSSIYKKRCKEDFRIAIRFILERNILWGDALSLKTPDKKEPIVFSEWSIIKNRMVKRRDFQYRELADFDPNRPTLFSLREVSDTGEIVFSPMPVKDFPLIHFLKLGV
jgi:hypothetical protein